MIVQKESAGQIRPIQPARRLRKARGSKVEQRQGSEEREIVHVGIKRPDQPGRRVKLLKRALRVLTEAFLNLSRVPVGGQNLRQSPHAQQRQRKSGRKQRVNKTRGRRQQRPARANDRSGAEGKSRCVNERKLCLCVCELLAQSG